MNGEVANVDPWGALFNSTTSGTSSPTCTSAGFIVAGFLVAGVYAWTWLKGAATVLRAALIVPLTFACLLAPVQLIVGDWAAAPWPRTSH